MNESAFSRIFRRDLVEFATNKNYFFKRKRAKKRIHLYLIQDSYRSGRKPYDFYFLYHKHFVAVELKSLKGLSLPLNVLSPHQKMYLEEVDSISSSSHSVIVINLQVTGDKQALVLTIKEYNDILRNNYPNKSVKFESLKEAGYTFIERDKIDRKLKWDIADFFNKLFVRTKKHKD
jgi:penicillin-binding protein-related factor A (putative recombinase)